MKLQAIMVPGVLQISPVEPPIAMGLQSVDSDNGANAADASYAAGPG